MAGGVPCPNAIVRVVAGDDGVVPRRPGKDVAVGIAVVDDGVVPGRPSRGVVDDDAFENPTKRQNVADGKCGAATGVDELARVHAPDVTDGERGAAVIVVPVAG